MSRDAVGGWLLLFIGAFIALVGLVWILWPFVPWGRLPGDVSIERENLRLYFPVTTCILLSVAFTLVAWLARCFLR